MEAGNKVCNRCKIEKPLIEFYNHPTGKDGKTSGCKECIKAYNKQYEWGRERSFAYRLKRTEYYNRMYRADDTKWYIPMLTRVKAIYILI